MRTVTLYLCVVACAVSVQRADSVRLCGRKLADLLALICLERGGFHTPVERRSVPVIVKRDSDAYYIAKRTLFRPNSATESGVVNECCRKSCTLSTLESYCAAPRTDDEIDLKPLDVPPVPSEQQITRHSQTQQVMNVVTSASTKELSPSRGRPNLSSFSRDRPFFFVISSPLLPEIDEVFDDILQS